MSVEEPHATTSDSLRVSATDASRVDDSLDVPMSKTPSANALDFPVEPLTASMLGKLFGVPLLIISIIVGGAVCVVLLFGAPTAPKAHSLDDLLQALEVSGGQRNAGMLLPREKEHWQAGLELSERLKKGEFSDEQLETAADRLIHMLEQEMSASPSKQLSSKTSRTNASSAGALHVQFLIRALGRTNRPQVIPVLTSILHNPWHTYLDKDRKGFLVYAIQELANLHTIEGADSAVNQMLALLKEMDDTTIRLAACTALSVLADRDNHAVIDALSSVRLSSDGEVSWSASLALARLGSNAGKSTLLDLLDRTFWETGERYHTTDDNGVTRSYAMPAVLIQQWLMAAIDASANLDDADLWEMINRLKSDASPAVQQRAKTVSAVRST